MVGIGTRQLYLLHGVIGARGGWDQKPGIVDSCLAKGDDYLHYITSTWSPRGNRHHAKHSCQRDSSDWVARDIPHIPPSAYTA
eukprot:5653687-Pleurochrysis_carterae.AAC.3